MDEQVINSRIKQLFMEINSYWIKTTARLNEGSGSWTRRRKMPLSDIINCTLGKKGLSTAIELRQFSRAAGKAEQQVSKQDYLKQRQNLNPQAFIVLNRNYLKRFYESEEPKGWEGYLVLVVDGSRAEIPNSRENREKYGEATNQYGKGVARASLSVLYDMYNQFILNIEIDPYNTSEIEAAKAHIEELKEIVGGRPVLIIFDRLYASLEFIDVLEKAGINYLMRVQSGAYGAELEQMEQNDEEVELAHTKWRVRAVKRSDPGRVEEFKKKKLTRARIVKTIFENGQAGTYITSLREGASYDILELYRNRWAIEKKYNTLKNKMKFESVTGKASIYVEQDFWAQTLVFNMLQDIIKVAEQRAAARAKEKKYLYEVRVNENIAIGLFKEQFIQLMVEDDYHRKDVMFKRLITDMEKNIVPIRKLKNSPRKWNNVNKYKCNQKPTF